MTDPSFVAEFLAEQGRLADAATPAPWNTEIDHHRCYLEYEGDCEHKSSPITERFVFRASEGDLADAVTHVHESYEAHQIGPDVAGNYDYEEGGIIHTEDAEFIAASRTSVPRMVKALEAVLENHQRTVRQPKRPEDLPTEYCAKCQHYSLGTYPCADVMAITAALEGENE